MITKQNVGTRSAVKWPVLLTASALAVAPFLNPIAVHAAPKNPTWDDRNYKLNVNPTTNGNFIASGVVTSDQAGNQFTLRANDGRTYRVVTTNKEPGWLTNGDRVDVRGRYDSRNQNTIIATSVTQSNGTGGIGNEVGQIITLNGVVASDLAGNQFTLRANDGRTYRVVTNRKEPGWLTNGDRVEVRGRLTNSSQNLIVASSVTQSNGVGGIGGDVKNVTVSGVVASDLEGNEFNMRATDGHIYRVVTNRKEPGWLSNGDRVEVRGQINSLNQNRIVATSVTHPGGGNVGNGNGVGQVITVSGVVTRDPAGNQFTVRADDGRTYRVITNNQEPGWVTNGDRVTVRGKLDTSDRTLIIATSVTHPNGVGGVGNGLNVTLSGIVTRDPAGNQFSLRTDDGRTYRVITNNQEPGWLTNGDRVTVRGKRTAANSTLIIATSVTHPNGTGVGAGTGQSVSIGGVVTRDRSGNQFTLRADNGQTYRVTTTNREPGWLTNGDRVIVRGRFDARDRDLIIATSVDHPAGTVRTNNTGGNAAVNFFGRVETVSNNGLIRTLRVRGDNGAVYVVTYRNLQTFRVGDRVRVIGTFSNGKVTASSVSVG